MDTITGYKLAILISNYALNVFCFKYVFKFYNKIKFVCFLAIPVYFYYDYQISKFLVGCVNNYTMSRSDYYSLQALFNWETIVVWGLLIVSAVGTINPTKYDRKTADLNFLAWLIYLPIYAILKILQFPKRLIGAHMCEYCGTFYFTIIGVALCHSKMRKKKLPPIYQMNYLTNTAERIGDPTLEEMWILGRKHNCPLCGGEGHNAMGAICERCDGFGKVF